MRLCTFSVQTGALRFRVSDLCSLQTVNISSAEAPHRQGTIVSCPLSALWIFSVVLPGYKHNTAIIATVRVRQAYSRDPTAVCLFLALTSSDSMHGRFLRLLVCRLTFQRSSRLFPLSCQSILSVLFCLAFLQCTDKTKQRKGSCKWY